MRTFFFFFFAFLPCLSAVLVIRDYFILNISLSLSPSLGRKSSLIMEMRLIVVYARPEIPTLAFFFPLSRARSPIIRFFMSSVNTCLVYASTTRENHFFPLSLSHANHLREFEEIIQIFFSSLSFSRSYTTITSDNSYIYKKKERKKERRRNDEQQAHIVRFLRLSDIQRTKFDVEQLE